MWAPEDTDPAGTSHSPRGEVPTGPRQTGKLGWHLSSIHNSKSLAPNAHRWRNGWIQASRGPAAETGVGEDV